MRLLKPLLGTFLLAVLIALPACSRSAASLDQREDRDPLLKRALAAKSAEDLDGAIDLCNKALERKPNLARAHLELGYLYDKHKEDYVRAIYHYQRYLELRPNAEKKKLIEDLIRQARLSFAATLPDQPSEAARLVAMLKQEVEALKMQLARQSGAAAPKPSKPAGTSATAATGGGLQPPKPEPAQPAVQTYVVQQGDTLSSIAGKVMGNPGKWNTIFEANRNVLPSPESVKVGQTLVIPR